MSIHGDPEKEPDTASRTPGGHLGSLRSHLIGSTAARGGVQVLARLRSLVLIVVISQWMGAREYGMWSQVIATLGLLTPLLALSLPSAMSRYFPALADRRRLRNELFTLFAFVSAISLCLLGLGAISLSSVSSIVFGESRYTAEALLFLLLMVVRTLLFVLRHYYRGVNRIIAYSVLEGVQSVCELAVIAIVVIGFSAPFASLLWGILLVDLAILLTMLAAIVRDVGWPQRLSLTAVGRYLAFSLPLIPNALLLWVINLSDRYVITHHLGLEMAGTYAIAYQLGGLVMLCMMPFSFGFVPLASRLWSEGRPQAVSRYMRHVLRYFTMLALPATGGLWLLAARAGRLLGGSEIDTPGYLVLLIACGLGAHAISMITAFPLNLAEQTRKVLPVSVGAAVLNLGLNLWLVPRWGIPAAAASTCLTYVARTLVLYGMSRRILTFSWDLKALTATLFSTGVMLAAVHWIPRWAVRHLAFEVVLGVVVYFAAMLAVGGVTRDDLGLIRSLVSKIVRRGT